MGYIQAKAKLAQSTISNDMGLLRNAGLVISSRHEQWTIYRRDKVETALVMKHLVDEILNNDR